MRGAFWELHGELLQGHHYFESRRGSPPLLLRLRGHQKIDLWYTVIPSVDGLVRGGIKAPKVVRDPVQGAPQLPQSGDGKPSLEMENC